MEINFIVFASPLFLLLIGIECYISLRNKTDRYQLDDSVNNFSTGILEEIGVLPMKGVILFAYYYLYEHYALLHFSSTAIYSWIVLWLGVDFFYYWYHRCSHRNTFLWIGHSVHHQSAYYNLSVALRQGFLQTMTSWVFYLPLALLGFAPWMFVAMVSLNTIYQFWIHTQSINKMGWFEVVFNTPSHHRVHHGTNPQYIDKNYAGSLIIWDKLFGTFEPEGEPAIYGVTEPLESWNPFYANIKVIKDVLFYSKGFKNKLNALRAFFMPPEWINQQLEQDGVVMPQRGENKPISNAPRWYFILNLLFCVFLYSYLSLTFNLSSPISWIIGGLILLSLYQLGRISNGHNKIQGLELIRTAVLSSALYFIFNNLTIAASWGILFWAGNFLLYNSIPTRTYSYMAKY